MYMVDGELQLRDLFLFRLLQSVRHYSPEPIQYLRIQMTRKLSLQKKKGCKEKGRKEKGRGVP